MTGMQRFVTYIYAYENGQKTHNSGYAKIETRGNNGRIEIHLDSKNSLGKELKVVFLAIQDNKIAEISLGFLHSENGRGVFLFNTEAILNTEINFERIVGVKIADANEQLHMSFWKDVKLPEPESEVRTENEKKTEEKAERKELNQEEDFEEVEEEVLHSMEIPIQNTFSVSTMEEVWKSLEKRRGGIQLKDGICALKIELSDLREFPKKYWYLGNNSFLLHGFFNYHHLLLGKMPDGRWFLGVPGVYERQERIMASFFGFAEYLPEGIWYHILNNYEE